MAAKDPWKRGRVPSILRLLGDTLLTFVRSLHPDSYPGFVSRPLLSCLGYFFLLVFLSLAVTTVVFCVRVPAYKNMLEGEFGKFDRFMVSANVSQREPVVFGTHHPVIIDMDSNQTSLSYETAVITNDSLIMRPLSCLISPAACLFSKEKSVVKSTSDFADVTAYAKPVLTTLAVLMFVLLPFLFVVLFVWYSLVFLLWFGLLTGLGSILAFAAKRTLHPLVLFRSALYASSVLVVSTIANLSLGLQMYYIPLAITLVYFVIAVLLTTDKKITFIKEAKQKES